MNLLGTAARPTRYTDCKPGSTIRIIDTQGMTDPFEALVVDMRPEHGPNAVPALFIRVGGDDDVQLITATGRYNVELLVDSSGLFEAAESVNTAHFVARPVEITAIKFTGGLDSASEIIKFAAGKKVVSWRQADDQHAEALIVHTVSGEAVCVVGWWVGGMGDNIYPIDPDVMATKYDQVASA